jgi:hypothetical protein
VGTGPAGEEQTINVCEKQATLEAIWLRVEGQLRPLQIPPGTTDIQIQLKTKG